MPIADAPTFEGSLAAYDAAGYPVLYHAIHPDERLWLVFCPDCANVPTVRTQLTAWERFLEGCDETCNGCGRAYRSAHGDPLEHAA